MRNGRRTWLAAAGWLTVLAALAYMAHLSWFKWGDLVIDTGREIYVPEALTRGRVLYRDLFYVYGPFSPYFNALLYELFGVHLRSLVLGGFLAVLASCALLYRLARIYLSPGLSLFTLLGFVVLFPFGHGNVVANYNFLIPYSYPAVHSLVLSLAALLFLHRHLATGARGAWWACAAFLFLALLTKVEVAVGLAASLGAGLYLHRRTGGASRTRAAAGVLGALLLPMAAAAVVYRGLYVPADARLLSTNLLDTLVSNLRMPEGSLAWRLFSGGEPGFGALLLAAKSLQLVLLGAALAGGGLLFDRAVRSEDAAKRRFARALTLGGCAAVCGGLVGFFPWPSLTLHFRAVPVACAAAIVLVAAGRWRGERAGEAQEPFLVALAVFALLLLGRMLLNVGVGWFGFYLLVPGFLLLHVLAFRVVPDLLPAGSPRRFLVAGFLVLHALVVGEHLLGYRRFFASMENRVHTDRGDLHGLDPRQAAAFSALLRDLSAPEFRGKTLVAFPEGLAINFFSGLPNPLYWYQYLPIDFGSPEAFDLLIEDFERKKPDYFVLLYRPVQEYGFEDYLEYAAPLQRYIEDHYRILASYDEILHLAKRHR